MIFGSPHENGFTSSICKYFLSNIESNYEIKIIKAFKSNFKPCIDCKFCQKSLDCAFDDMKNFDLLFRSSDLLVIASPVYNFSFPAPLKAIIDRFQRYYNEKHYLNSRFVPKKVVLILTCGRENNDKWIEIFKNQMNIFLKSVSLQLVHTIYLKNTDKLKLGIDNLPKDIRMIVNNVVRDL